MKHIFSRTLVAAIALVPAAHAGTDRWTPFGPGDGRLTSLVASSRGDLYVTSAFTAAEIWQRPASASRWRWRNAGLGRPDGTETFGGGTSAPTAAARNETLAALCRGDCRIG